MRIRRCILDKELKVLEKYIITTCGRVFSNLNTRFHGKWTELKTRIDKDGYLEVPLVYGNNGERQPFKIHRLVALEYLENCPYSIRIVNHKNCIKNKNYIQNLEWTTVSLNTQHGFDNLCYKDIKQVMVSDVLTNTSKTFPSASSAMRYYKISVGNIVNIMKNKKYTKLKNLRFEYV